jgi:hypothetical protein
MNFDDLQNAWNTPRNQLPTAEQERLAQQFTRQMIRRRRFQAIWLVNTIVWLTLITVLAIWVIAVGKANPAQEWGLFPLLILPWAFAVYFLRQYRKSTSLARGDLSVSDSLRRALGANRTEQSHLKCVTVLFTIMIPLITLSMHQLRGVGKMSSSELASMAILFGTTLLASGAGIAIRYFGRLLPQQRQIKALLAELTE